MCKVRKLRRAGSAHLDDATESVALGWGLSAGSQDFDLNQLNRRSDEHVLPRKFEIVGNSVF